MNKYVPGCNCCGGCSYTVSGNISRCGNISSPVIAGVGVTVKDHGSGAVLWTGVTNSSGNYATSTLTMSGTSLSVDVVADYGGTTRTATYTVVCGANVNKNVVGFPLSQVTIFVSNPCGIPGSPGAGPKWTVTISGPLGSTTTSTGTTYVKTLPPGSYTYTVGASRFNTFSGSFTVLSACAPVSSTATMTVASGYACSCFGTIPLKTVLQWSGIGTSGTATYNSGTGQWSGTGSASFPGWHVGGPCCVGLAGQTVPFTLYLCPSAIVYKSNGDTCPDSTLTDTGFGPSSTGPLPPDTDPLAFSYTETYHLSLRGLRGIDMCPDDDPVTWTE